MRVISVTPAGRKRYLEILAHYLLKNRRHIAEHHFWLNTECAQDVAFIHSLAEKHPDFFKINKKPIWAPDHLPFSIWQYFQDYIDADTVYLRFDDDICYIADDAIPNLIRYRLDHPEPFLVYGNIVNNALCSHLQQRRGVIPMDWGAVAYDATCPVGWRSAVFAEKLHKRFISDVCRAKIERWKFPNHAVSEFNRFSINAIAWLGKDMRAVDELRVRDLRDMAIPYPAAGEGRIIESEEEFLTETLPRRFNRPAAICGNAIFSHFAFYTQTSYLDNATLVLSRYKALTGTSRWYSLIAQPPRWLQPVFWLTESMIKSIHYPYERAKSILRPIVKKHFPALVVFVRERRLKSRAD